MGWTKRGVERVKKLTAKQEAEIPRFADKWNAIARSTEPWNKEGVKEGMKRFLKAMGCRQPKNGFWWHESRVKAWEGARFRWEDAQKGIRRSSA